MFICLNILVYVLHTSFSLWRTVIFYESKQSSSHVVQKDIYDRFYYQRYQLPSTFWPLFYYFIIDLSLPSKLCSSGLQQVLGWLSSKGQKQTHTHSSFDLITHPCKASPAQTNLYCEWTFCGTPTNVLMLLANGLKWLLLTIHTSFFFFFHQCNPSIFQY